MEKINFKVIIRGRNCKAYIHDCLNALLKQTYGNWSATIILDAPEDESYKTVKEYEKNKQIKIFLNKKRKGVAANIYKGIKLACAEDEDVIVIYDADDELTKDALATVAKAYKNNKILATYGSYWRFDIKRKTKTSKPYNKNKPIRKQKWHGSHLKTFKYKLYKHLPKEYLKDSNGEWYQAASDLALMIPLLELAGLDRTKHIKKCIYKWRRTPFKTRGHLQKRCKKEIYKKKPLQRVKI